MLIVDSNALSALRDEAHIDPEWMHHTDLDAEIECFAITLPDYTSLIPLTRAILLYLPEELADEMVSEFDTYSDARSPFVTIYWPGLHAPDLIHFKAAA